MEFPIASSPSYTVLIAGLIAAITLSIGAAFTWFAFTADSLSVTLDDSALRIDLPFYGRSIPLSQLDVSSAQIVTLNRSSDFRPRIRTNGIGLPGYAVGWFRLRNGDKALAAVTSKQKVLYLQTTDGYVLLLSLNEPKGFLDKLNEFKKNDP